MEKIPLATPSLTEQELANVVDAVQSTWISSSGEFLTRFEGEFADVCGTTSALAVSNGTVALHLVLLALGVGPGDEVIVPSLTYVATANAVTYVGARPVFADVERESWCIDPTSVASLIGPRTVGVIAVHLYGHPADMDELSRIANAKGLWLVEDAAEATFGTYRERPVGSLGTAATFSFYGNKVITSGEGGAVTTSDDQLAARMRLVRGQGMDPNRRYYFEIVGHNFRLTNLAAAILCAQLQRRDEILEERNRITQRYRQLLEGDASLAMQPIASWVTWVPWLFSVLVLPHSRFQRDELAERLRDDGIETRPFFVPIHTLPPYAGSFAEQGNELQVTHELASQGINLPTYPGLSMHNVELVASRVRELLRSKT